MKPLPKLAAGMKRAYVKCKQCSAVYWYDFQPFSLSAGVVVKPCGHGITQRLYETSKTITRAQFDAARRKAERKAR